MGGRGRPPTKCVDCSPPSVTGACGTTTGYYRHYRAEEAACDRCKAAVNESVKQRYVPGVYSDRECDHCGLLFSPRQEDQRFCSKKCKKRWRWRNQPSQKVRESRRWRLKVIRLEIYSRDRWICQLCRDPVDRDDFEWVGGAFHVGPRYPTLDHILPISLGGSDEPANLQTAHHLCNASKYNLAAGSQMRLL